MDLGRFTPSKGANRQQAVGKELLLESEYLRDHIKAIAPQYPDDFIILPYVDISQEIGLGNEDSHDRSHLVEPGRELWEQRLAEELAGFDERQGDAGAGGAGDEP